MADERCLNHVDSSLWVRCPIPDRPGWEEARCSLCRCLIGYNPIRSAKETKKTDAGVDLELTGGERVQNRSADDSLLF